MPSTEGTQAKTQFTPQARLTHHQPGFFMHTKKPPNGCHGLTVPGKPCLHAPPVPRLDAKRRSQVDDTMNTQSTDCAEDREPGHPAWSERTQDDRMEYELFLVDTEYTFILQ